MKKEYISATQCALLLVASTLGISLMLDPSVISSFAKQDAWLVPWLCIIPGLVLLGLLLSLNKMYPGQSIVQYSTAILGPPGKLLVLIIIWFFLYSGGQVLREIINFVKSFMLFETPLTVIYFFTTLLCAFALKMGIEVMARALCTLIVVVLFLRFVIHGYTLIDADFSKLQPILSAGALPLIHASVQFTASPVAATIILFSMVLYHVKNPRELNVTIYPGFVLVSAFLCLIIQQALVTIGPDRTARNLYAVASTINATAGGGLVLPFMVLVWFSFSLCQFIFCYYAFVTSVAHWAKLSDYKHLILPSGPLFITMGIYSFNNSIEAFDYYLSVWPIYALASAFSVPLLLWLAAITKKLLHLDRPRY